MPNIRVLSRWDIPLPGLPMQSKAGCPFHGRKAIFICIGCGQVVKLETIIATPLSALLCSTIQKSGS